MWTSAEHVVSKDNSENSMSSTLSIARQELLQLVGWYISNDYRCYYGCFRCWRVNNLMKITQRIIGCGLKVPMVEVSNYQNICIEINHYWFCWNYLLSANIIIIPTKLISQKLLQYPKSIQNVYTPWLLKMLGNIMWVAVWEISLPENKKKYVPFTA